MANVASRQLTEAHRLAQVNLRKATIVTMSSRWFLLDYDNLDGTTDLWLDAITPLVDRLNKQSSALARTYYRTHRIALIGGHFDPPTVSLDFDAFHVSMRATGPATVKAWTGRTSPSEAMRKGMAASSTSASRHVLSGSRDTLIVSSQSDPRVTSWSRATSASPCGFCAMLATRTDYNTESSASFSAHDSCGCQPEPVYDGDWEPSGTQQQWIDLYESEKAKGGDSDEILARMRLALR